MVLREDVLAVVERALAGRATTHVLGDHARRHWRAIRTAPAGTLIPERVADLVLCQAGRPDLADQLERI